ncbi:MAG: hypothetical protein ACPG77_11480 [Nannocystaceae bacterium]
MIKQTILLPILLGACSLLACSPATEKKVEEAGEKAGQAVEAGAAASKEAAKDVQATTKAWKDKADARMDAIGKNLMRRPRLPAKM